MVKRHKKYKWADRDEHFRSADLILRQLKIWDKTLLMFPLHHVGIEEKRTRGIYSYLGIETPQGELSVINN